MSLEDLASVRWEFGQDLSAEELAAVEAERRSLNLRRARSILAPLLVVIVAAATVFAYIVVPSNEAQQAWRDNAVALTNVLIGCNVLALIAVTRLPALATSAAEAIGPCFALWGALSSANIQRTRPAVDFFLLTSLSLVFVFRHRLGALLVTQALGGAALVAGIVGLQADRAVARTELGVVVVVTLMVLVVGRTNLVHLARGVTTRRVIERQGAELEAQRRELASLNESLEGRVQSQVAVIVQRSKEVDQLNAELRERVDQGARDLAALLHRVGRAQEGDELGPGSVLNERFVIESVLGAGGMSVVYRAVDRRTGEPVAVKVISAGSAHELDAMRRFLREARASVRVEHPAVVSARHVDLAGGQLFAVFPLVEGTALDRVLQGGVRLSVARAVRLGRLIADALAAAHAVGVVHRDIKPGNVMLTPNDQEVRLLDFGISKFYEAGPQSTRETREGTTLGTPVYMAPEQVTDAALAGDRADIYSLGVVMFEFLAGRPPFSGRIARAILVAHVYQAPPSLRDACPAAPEALCDLVLRCLSKAPADRPSARELCDQLATIEATLTDDHRAVPPPSVDHPSVVSSATTLLEDG